MFALVKRLSSTIRRLAERHARVQGKVKRLEALIVRHTSELERAQAEHKALALLLPSFDHRVQPAQIAPVAGWEGTYGKRGALRAAVLIFLQSAGGEWMTTTQVALLVRQHFGLDFACRTDERKWVTGILRTRLVALVEEGLAERSKVGAHHSAAACWRLAQGAKAPSLDDLRVQAEGLACA